MPRGAAAPGPYTPAPAVRTARYAQGPAAGAPAAAAPPPLGDQPSAVIPGGGASSLSSSAPLGPPPTMPMAAPPVAVSPGGVGKKVHVVTVASVDVFLQWCCAAVDTFDFFMQDSSPTDQAAICAILR